MIRISNTRTSEWETARPFTSFWVNVLIVQMGRWRLPKVTPKVGEELAGTCGTPGLLGKGPSGPGKPLFVFSAPVATALSFQIVSPLKGGPIW